jgi:hypothetical protein
LQICTAGSAHIEAHPNCPEVELGANAVERLAGEDLLRVLEELVFLGADVLSQQGREPLEIGNRWSVAEPLDQRADFIVFPP